MTAPASGPAAPGVRWDLSGLYKSSSDPKLAADLETARQKALAFESQYKSFFEPAKASSLPLADLLRDYKEIVILLTKPGVYTHLSFAEQTDDPARAAFMQKTQVTLTDIQNHLVFFEVGWNRMD